MSLVQPVLLSKPSSSTRSLSSPSSFSNLPASSTTLAHPSSPATFPAPNTAELLSPSADQNATLSSSSSLGDAQLLTSAELGSPQNGATQPHFDVDPQILEALRSKDRIYVLKLGELMEGLINDRRTRVDLTPSTSYQRLLVHRCSAYYRLLPESDPSSKSIIVSMTIESRIPARRLCELVPAEPTAQPAFKIMRRSLQDRRPKSQSQSQAGSVAGEDADLSDVEPSESGSLGGRSNATGGSSSKKHLTFEEKEAAYNEARSRIFMGFDEKEKEKDMSASSSSLSLVSGSASTGGGGGSSSAGDLEDPVSSPATESEWSGPSGQLPRDKKENRRTLPYQSNPLSSGRSLRSSVPSYSNGSSSSRNSRAPSPAFTYASLSEPPPPPNSSYEVQQHHGHPPNAAYQQPQYVQYYQPPPPHVAAFPHPYPPYYPHYNPYQIQPGHPHPHPNGLEAPPAPEHYPPSHPAGYGNLYGWPPHHPNQPGFSLPPPPPPPPQLQQQHLHQQQTTPPHPNGGHLVNPPPPNPNPQYHPYIPPSHAYSYPPPSAYYPPPGQPMHQQPPPPPPPQQQHMGLQPHTFDGSRPMNGNMMSQLNTNQPPHRSMSMNGNMGSPTHTRSSSRGSVNGPPSIQKPRNGIPPPQNRSPWSYGPGLGGGSAYSGVINGPNGGESIGPRINTVRRTSGNSGGTGNHRTSSNGDDVSSIASSSTTSSTSRRTYTSTSSSQHPLPQRPDWAVGLKPQPTLHSRPHHDSLNNSRTMSPMSPPRSLNNHAPLHPHLLHASPQQLPPITLQSTDFPPLTTSIPTTPLEKRMHVAAGAWGNASARNILTPNQGHLNGVNSHPNHQANTGPIGNANVNSFNLGPNGRLDEPDRGFERPAPKSSELFNPKVARRPANSSNNSNGSNNSIGSPNAQSVPNGKPAATSGEHPTSKEKERARGDAVASAILVGQVAAMTFEDSSTSGTASSEGTKAIEREHGAVVLST